MWTGPCAPGAALVACQAASHQEEKAGLSHRVEEASLDTWDPCTNFLTSSTWATVHQAPLNILSLF